MYQLYSEDCAFKQRQKIVCETLFRKTFSTSFNLSLVKQSKPCKVCKLNPKAPGRFVMSDKMIADQEEKLTAHREMLRVVKNNLISSVENAQTGENNEVFTFKLHKPIDLPYT